MRVGVDGRKIPFAAQRGPLGTLDHARELGLDGVFFRSILDLSPTLDPGMLAEIRARADAQDLYLEVGVGKVNPYATPEAPEIRALGDGDYRLGMERQIRAARAMGCTELWVATANYKPDLPGLFAIDRFRTDAPWPDQLAATERFLTTLVPLLREVGCRLNIETHEEITSFEVVRLVESVGPDVLGVTFDTANVLVRAEDPIAAARRIAPYVHLTHVRDALLSFTDEGLTRQVCPCGEGIIDWHRLVPILGEHAPGLHLSIECMERRLLMGIPIFDPRWQAAHPDLTIGELAEVIRLTREGERRSAVGMAVNVVAEPTLPSGDDEKLSFIRESAAYLRRLLAACGLDSINGPADEPAAFADVPRP
jgi:sugar phosphate isomerase/epimerase